MKISSRKTYPDWTDLTFTALPPGWVNVFENSDGTHYTQPCPGVLIQECTTLTDVWSEEHEDGRVQLRQQKRDTDREIRTVFVSAGYIGESFLRPVDDEQGYVVTTTPEQWAAWNADDAAETPA